MNSKINPAMSFHPVSVPPLDKAGRFVSPVIPVG
jgi:hypothetical protein